MEEYLENKYNNGKPATEDQLEVWRVAEELKEE